MHKTANPEWTKQVQNWLNDLCSYCGALTVDEFKKKHLRDWIHKKTTWNHNTQRNVIASVKAAFKFCCKFDDLEANPVAGYEKPTATPRIVAFTPEEEKQLYETANDRKSASWEMLLHLAAHAEQLDGIDQYDLSGVMDNRDQCPKIQSMQASEKR